MGNHGEGTSVCHLPLKLQVFLAGRSQCCVQISVGALSAKTHQQNSLGCKAKESQPPEPKVSWHQGPSSESSGLGSHLPKAGLDTLSMVMTISVLLVTLSHWFERGAVTLKHPLKQLMDFN